MADGAASAAGLAGLDEIDGEVGELVAGNELGERAAGAIDYGVAFKMALDAGTVALGGSEVLGVGDGAAAMLREMRGGVAVAGAAADAALPEGCGGVAVARGDLGWLNAGCVAEEAVGVDGERGGHAGRISVGGGHLPCAARRVEVDGQLEPLTVDLVQVGAALRGRADVILQTPLAGECAFEV